MPTQNKLKAMKAGNTRSGKPSNLKQGGRPGMYSATADMQKIMQKIAGQYKEARPGLQVSQSPVGSGGYNPQTRKGYKKGGKVKKTGMAKVHKGERVLTKKQNKKFNLSKNKAKFEKVRMALAKGN